MDFEQARFNMVEQQIRPWEVLDQRVLDLITQLHREDFVPQEYRNLAFADMHIPIGHGQVMMEPKLEARLVQELEIGANDRILEIGTGSGYLTALLARLGHHVLSVELFDDLSLSARQKLAAQRIANATLEVGDGAAGWGDARFDVIVLTGSVPAIPAAYRQQLNIGGRLAAVVGNAPAMEALVLTRVDAESWDTNSLFETDLPRLLNVEEPSAFVF